MTSGAAAYERLREAIVRVELEPGTPVSEAQLVERFGFTKAAVRAALARLRAEGLLLAEPRRGHVVAPLTMRDVLEIYECASRSNRAPRRLPRARWTAAEVARLQELADRVRRRRREARLLAANREIHLAIVTSGQPARGAIVERLLDDSERARILALRAGAAEGATGRGPSCIGARRRSATVTARGRAS